MVVVAAEVVCKFLILHSVCVCVRVAQAPPEDPKPQAQPPAERACVPRFLCHMAS